MSVSSLSTSGLIKKNTATGNGWFVPRVLYLNVARDEACLLLFPPLLYHSKIQELRMMFLLEKDYN